MIVEKYSATNFEKLEKIWAKMEHGKDMTVYQTYEWNSLLNKQYLRYGLIYRLICKYNYYVFYDNNEPKVILPLMIQKINLTLKDHGIKKGVYLIGTKNYSDYLNWIYYELNKEYFNFIIEWLKNNFKKYNISFLYIKDDTELNNELILTRGIKKIEDTISVYVNNEHSTETYNKMLSKNTRRSLKKSLNRIEKKNMLYEIKEYSKIDDSKLINTLINIHINRYIQKNSNNSKIVNYIKWIKEIVSEKYNNIIAQSMRKLDNSWLLVIYLNKQVAGYLYGLKWNKDVNIMQVSLNSKYSFFTPVIRGMYDYIIKMNCNSNCEIEKFDFTCGNERYKYDLNGKNRILHNFCIPMNNNKSSTLSRKLKLNN